MPTNIDLSPIEINHGQLAIGHRPKVKSLKAFTEIGVTHILTLISEKEGALDIQKAAEAQGLEWLWIPLENAIPPELERHEYFKQKFEEVAEQLELGACVYVHCAAGIHRTGMISYALLRYLGLNAAQAYGKLKEMRELSAQEVGMKRLAWGDTFATNFAPFFTSGELTLEDLHIHNFKGYTCYAHSVGEGYQYRGTVGQISEDGEISITDVETASNDECDFDFKNPYSIGGVWEKYEDIEYYADGFTAEATSKGIVITYPYSGTVYIHYQQY